MAGKYKMRRGSGSKYFYSDSFSYHIKQHSQFTTQSVKENSFLVAQILPSEAYKTTYIHKGGKGLLSEVLFINTNLEG